MSIGKLFLRLIRGPQQPPLPMRLPEERAIELAQHAASAHWLRHTLRAATAVRRPDGTLVWHVESAGVGAYLRVVIDDATGDTVEVVSREGR